MPYSDRESAHRHSFRIMTSPRYCVICQRDIPLDEPMSSPDLHCPNCSHLTSGHQRTFTGYQDSMYACMEDAMCACTWSPMDIWRKAPDADFTSLHAAPVANSLDSVQEVLESIGRAERYRAIIEEAREILNTPVPVAYLVQAETIVKVADILAKADQVGGD